MGKNECSFKTSIGGQALIEGIMMRSNSNKMKENKCAMAVRNPSGEIVLEQWSDTQPGKWYNKTPFIRGIFNFISMLVLGYKTLMRSAEIAGVEEEPSAFEKKLAEKLGDNFSKLYGAVVGIVSLGLALVLFMLIPSSISMLLAKFTDSSLVLTAAEGVIKIVIFILYLFVISRLNDIKRTFQYHGAEHKTIFCYEHGEELTVENVRKQSRFHPRCGTSFLLIVLVISILVFSVATWDTLIMRILIKLLLLPVVVGISYEILKLAGRYENRFTAIISAPGLWLQRLTTLEPDDDQIEVAIAAIKAVMPENYNDALY